MRNRYAAPFDAKTTDTGDHGIHSKSEQIPTQFKRAIVRSHRKVLTRC